MSSSSDDTEDDEIAKKISASICNETILLPILPTVTVSVRSTVHGEIRSHTETHDNHHHVHETQTQSQQSRSEPGRVGPVVAVGSVDTFRESSSTKKAELLNKEHMRNTRYHDSSANQCSENVLNTTPGFRAHVSKQLSVLLDQKLKDLLSDNVWKCSRLRKTTSKGIHLFSNSKIRCCLPEDENSVKRTCLETNIVTKPKKRSISSNSENSSSDDEKIMACVFSQEDIQKENELLSKLEKPRDNSETSPNQSVPNKRAESISVDSELHKKHKKKKRKKDKSINTSIC